MLDISDSFCIKAPEFDVQGYSVAVEFRSYLR